MKCNMDCFHCEYDDCINDTLSLADYREDISPEEISTEKKKARLRANKYAKTHREKNRTRALQHYRDNKQKHNEYSTKWQKDNRERVAAAARERYHRDIERKRQYLRDYRERKKRERQAV